MDNSVYNLPSGYFMRTDVEKLVGLRFHGVYYTGSICQIYKKGVAKVIVGICIPRLWKVLLKLRVSFDVLVSRKKVLSKYSHHI